MHIAVLIPFRDRGDQKLLGWTLEGYAGQILSPGNSTEVHVGIDGGDTSATSAVQEMDVPGRAKVTVHAYPRIGAAAVRNKLAQECSGETELLIFGNADARPEPDMVQRHADAMRSLPPKSLVLGSAPWEKPPQPTVFDALLADTPMVFFYNQLTPHTWYDFRHCWTLNLSVRLQDFRASGGFHEILRPVYYEDLAFAFRLLGPDRKGVWYEPDARVLHRHPTTLQQYLDREELLGLMSPVLAQAEPAAFAALHGTIDPHSLSKPFRDWLAMDAAMHKWIFKRLQEWAALPETDAGTGKSRERLLMTIYQMHIPLKRLAFRLGYLRGLELLNDARWQERQPNGMWRSFVG